uniref:NADP-dependent oxidoreductase domain-containing protein n=1 Tax=Parascaris univalens TaxID=6257 RepID=A0A915CCP1_PARUN
MYNIISSKQMTAKLAPIVSFRSRHDVVFICFGNSLWGPQTYYLIYNFPCSPVLIRKGIKYETSIRSKLLYSSCTELRRVQPAVMRPMQSLCGF